jgi:hypothetical protein
MSLTNILKTWKDYPTILLEKYPDAGDFYARYGPIHLVEGIIASALLYQATDVPESLILAPLFMMGRNMQLIKNYNNRD